MLLFVFVFCSSTNAQNTKQNNLISLYNKAKSYRYLYPDSAIELFNYCSDEFLAGGDTLRTVDCLIYNSSIFTSKANYSSAYDGFWQALILANKIKNERAKSDIYSGLGMLYSLFRRYEEANEYLSKSLHLRKKLIQKNILPHTYLVNSYHSYANTNRELGNYELAKQYIDSCLLLTADYSPNNAPHKFISAELAYYKYHNGEYKEALELLKVVEEHFKGSMDSYLVIIYAYMGDAYLALKSYTRSLSYYQKAIDIGKQYKSHVNFIPDIFKKRAKVYYKIRRYREAYNMLDTYAHLNDSLFGARNVNNKQLLEIKDAFRLEQEEQQKLIETANLEQLKKNERILFLRNTLLSISLAFIVLLSVGLYFYLKYKNSLAKKILLNKQKIQQEKSQEVLEVKNKELTTSALKLIEKDEMLIEVKEMLQKLNEQNPQVDLKAVLRKIKTNSSQDWSEFNARFTAVNDSFYTKLRERFPELTQRDHKLCALVKLNFSSKEMAQLLGISIESVHTSRYRLRKKLNLDKGENLTEFMASI